MTIPSQPNSWCLLPNGGLVARLGTTEFLVEGDAALVDKIMQAKRAPGVYPVLRQDAAFALCGARVNELLPANLQRRFQNAGCRTNESRSDFDGRCGRNHPVQKNGTHPSYRIWCDGTYGIYLWETLADIATELGGGCIGVNALL